MKNEKDAAHPIPAVDDAQTDSADSTGEIENLHTPMEPGVVTQLNAKKVAIGGGE